MKKLLLLLLLLPVGAAAQTPARFDLPVLTTTPSQVPPGSLPNLLAVTNATVSVCQYPATLSGGMCTNTVTTYTDSTLSTACPSTAQLTAPGSAACISTTGLQGSLGFWYNSDTQTHMVYTLQTAWGTFGPYDILQGAGGGGSGTVSNFSSGNLAPLFTTSAANPTTTPALSFTPSPFAAHTFYGNNGSSTATPGAALVGVSDWSPNAYVAGGGSAQAQTVTLNPPATALTAGLEVRWLPIAANTGAQPTLNVNGLGASAITKLGIVPLVANDLTTTAVADAIYDGARWQLQNPQTNAGTGEITLAGDANGPTGANTVNSLTIAGGSIPLYPNIETVEAGAPMVYNGTQINFGAPYVPASGGTFTGAITVPSCTGCGGSPGGSSGDVQVNNSGAFGAATSAQIVTALNTSPGSTYLSNLLLGTPQVYGSTPFLGFSATNGGSNIAGITITSNPTSFTFGNGTPGDLTGSIVAKTINTTDLVVGSNGLLSLIAADPAGPNNNYPSTAVNWSAQIYNGTENAADEFDAQNVVGTGTNPTATLAFTHLDGGTTGAVTYRFDNNVLVNAGVTADTATISNLIGDDGCLESVGGVVTSTGAACGSGSGEVSSVFGRTGAVVAATGDYTAAQVTDTAATNVANTFTAVQTISPSSGDAGLNLIPTGGTEYGMFASATGDSPGYWYIVDNTEQRANFGMHSYNTYGDQVIFSNDSGLCWAGAYDIRGASCATGFFQAGAASLDLGTGASGSADGTLNLAIVAATTHITTPSIAGTGTATYTLGTSAVVGTGATIATTTGHVSDGMSGEVHLVTGTGITAATGTMFTVTLPITRTNDANCVFSPSTGGGNFMSGPSTTSTFTIGTNAELIASTNYYFDYWCGGN